MTEAILVTVACMFLYMTLIFLCSWHTKRLDVVDVAWGGAFIVAALSSLTFGAMGPLQYLVLTLILIWALRLSVAILLRFLRSKEEDPRYVAIRTAWRGHVLINAYFRIFLVQGALALVISASVIIINVSDYKEIGAYAVLGAMVWLIGFFFESIGDAQLKKHLANPANRGKLMMHGLWRYTRHPNYFGEAVQWWGIFIIALSVPYGWATIIAPITITILLLFISGVPLTEKRFEGKPGWADYKRRTSVFIPLPPRR